MLLVIVKAPHILCFRGEIRKNIQSKLDNSNIDGSFTMANSNSFFLSLRNSSISSRTNN